MEQLQTDSCSGCAVLNRDVIKYFAMFAMLLNHIAYIFLKPGTLVYEVFSDIGYFTGITMCFFLVEGYRHTRSKKRYALRLLVFALLSQLPYCLALTQEGILEYTGLNMIFTLFFCFLILAALEHLSNPYGRGVAVLLLICLTAFGDWALLAPIFTVLFAIWQNSRRKMGLAYGIAAALFGLLQFLSLTENYAFGASLLMAFGSCLGILASGAVVLFLYNGKRAAHGRNFSKWFFYAFYPTHLLVLGLLRIALQ